MGRPWAWLLLAALAAPPTDTLLSDLFPPVIGDSVRDLTDAFVREPLVQTASSLVGDAVSVTGDRLSALPLTVARALGFTGGVPSLLNDNIVALTDPILAAFELGLGNEDARLTLPELISKYGYPLEIHRVTTEDGYELTIHRIRGEGPAVFLMHGLLGSADDWVVAGPGNALAYRLADAGYDVWLGNARGSKHSRGHRTLTPLDGAYWDFSWHEIGIYDLPAMIDHVLQKNGTSTLKYVGHSQGTTSFFVMASQRPEYNAKVSLMVALSPVAWMSRVTSPLVRLLAPGGPVLHALATTFGMHEFLPDNGVVRALRTLMCGTGPLAELLCGNVLFLGAGFDIGQLNVTNLPVVFAHAPSGASIKQFVHYGQGVVSGGFRQFDYGQSENVRRYGTPTPPAYDMSRVTAPVSLYYSDGDWLAHPDDVDELYVRLGNAVDIHRVPHDAFNHLDYIWAKDVNVLINDRLLKLFMRF